MSKWAGESIHDAILSTLTSAPIGKKIAKFACTWNANGTPATIKFFDSTNSLLFTLTFAWNADGTFESCTRS